MFNISNYLEKFKKIGDRRDFIEQAAKESFKEAANIDIDPLSVRISHGKIVVSAPPASHAIIFMNRDKIISSLKKHLPEIIIEEIRCR